MPSDKKRINLTVPDALYERLQAFKAKNGITSDATACLQLITQQLNGQEQAELMLKVLNTTSLDKLLEMSREGLTYAKEELAPAVLEGRLPEKTGEGPPPGGG